MRKIQPTKNRLKKSYQALDLKLKLQVESENSIRSDLLIAFPYQYAKSQAEVVVDTDEFTALCPWTGLPDQGTLIIRYVPNKLCLELKSLKYYLLSFRSVGIVQEHAANRILKDLAQTCKPRRMSISLDYRTRGGLHTVVDVTYP